MKNIRFDSIWKTWIHVSFDGGMLKNGRCEAIVFRFPSIENRK